MRRIVALLVALSPFVPSAAVAHRFEHPRHMRVTVARSHIGLRLSFRMDAGGPSLRTRAAFDRDTDGRLTGREQPALQAFLLSKALKGLTIRRDGRLMSFVPSRVTVINGDRDANDGRPLQIIAYFRWPFSTDPKGTEVRLGLRSDATRRKHVPVFVDGGQGWRGQGIDKSGRIFDLSASKSFALHRQNPLQIVLLRVER